MLVSCYALLCIYVYEYGGRGKVGSNVVLFCNRVSFCKEQTIMLFSSKGGKGVYGSGRIRQGEFLFVSVMAKQS